MAVARFILASIAIALVAAQNIDCTNAPAPSGANMNYFAPSTDCRAANTDVEACFTQWTQCTGNAATCDAVNVCLQSVLICLDNIPAPAVVNTSSPCNAWNESFSNVKMYLDMGGAYSGSGLEGACKYAACTYIATVPKNGSACAVPATTCDGVPTPLKFFLTFGGNWSTLVTTKASQIRVALQRGIAKLLNVAEYSIRILSFKSGSLVVDFAVLDPSLDAATVQRALQNACYGNAATLAVAFAELQTVAGFAVCLFEDYCSCGKPTLVPLPPTPHTPVPGTPAPSTNVSGTPAQTSAPSSSASAVSAVVAVARVAMSLLFWRV